MFHSKTCFFSVVLPNLGKIRPSHWTLRGSDMPRMLCPARCRKVWKQQVLMIFMVDDLGLKPFYTFYEVSSGVLCVCLCLSRLLHIDMLYNLIVGTPFENWMFLPSKQTAADQQTTKDSSELFFWSLYYMYIYIYTYIYIYIFICLCVCALMMISLVPHFLMMLFHVFHHMFSWFSHSFPVFTHIFFLMFFSIFFSKRNSFPIFFHGFPRSHGTWRQHWQRRHHATAQPHGQPRGQPRQPRGQRSQSGGLGAMEFLGEDIGVCWLLFDMLTHG